MARYLYSEIANLVLARQNCMAAPQEGAKEWAAKHAESIRQLIDDYLPHGSGFDNGTRLAIAESHAEKLVFHASYHHMNDGGFYCGWTEHTVTVTPSFIGGFNLRVSGRNVNDIKDYIADAFAEALRTELPTPAGGTTQA